MSSKVQNLAPTDGIKDPQVRAFAESLSTAWQLRNGSVGADDKQRFVTKEEWDLVAKNPNLRAIAGIGQPGQSGSEPGPGADIAGGGGAVVVPPFIQNLVDFLATGITLYDFTNLRRTANDAFAAVFALTSKARADMGEVWAAIEALNTIVIGPGSATAEQIALLAAGVAANTAAIVQINTVTADSTSVNASELHTQIAAVGLKSKVFAQPSAPPLTQGTPPNDYTLKVNDLWINTSSNNAMMRWSGIAWVPAEDVRIAGSMAAITTEATTRATSDSAFVEAINAFWGEVGNSTSLVLHGSTISVNPNAGHARYFLDVQSAVIGPNGENLVAAVQEDLQTAVDVANNRANAGYSLKVEAGSGTPPIKAIAGMSLTAEVLNGTAQTACVFFVDNFLVTNRLNTNVQTAPFVINADGIVRMNVAHIVDYIQSDVFLPPDHPSAPDGWGWQIKKDGSATFYGAAFFAKVLSGSQLIDRDSGALLSSVATNTWFSGYGVSVNGAVKQTDDAVLFRGPGKHDEVPDTSRRVRRDNGVLLPTSVLFAGVADDRITIWTRHSTPSVVDPWVALNSTTTPANDYNAVTCAWVGFLPMKKNGWREFAVSATDASMVPLDAGKVLLKDFALTVSMTNL